MADVQKADPTARRAALLIITFGTIAGGVLLTLSAGSSGRRVAEWVKEDVYVRVRIVTALLMLLTTGPALGGAVYLWRLGQRVVRARQFPPPGLRVVRDTPLLAGERAVRRGRLLQALATTLGVAGLLLAFVLWRLVSLAV